MNRILLEYCQNVEGARLTLCKLAAFANAKSSAVAELVIKSPLPVK